MRRHVRFDHIADARVVEHVEHPILASIVGAVLDKVVGPDMIARRPQPNAKPSGLKLVERRHDLADAHEERCREIKQFRQRRSREAARRQRMWIGRPGGDGDFAELGTLDQTVKIRRVGVAQLVFKNTAANAEAAATPRLRMRDNRANEQLAMVGLAQFLNLARNLRRVVTIK